MEPLRSLIMTLNQILSDIKTNYNDMDIVHLAEAMENGDLTVRKQLADLVCREPARLRPMVILEIAGWGVNDELSQIPEIRNA